MLGLQNILSTCQRTQDVAVNSENCFNPEKSDTCDSFLMGLASTLMTLTDTAASVSPARTSFEELLPPAADDHGDGDSGGDADRDGDTSDTSEDDSDDDGEIKELLGDSGVAVNHPREEVQGRVPRPLSLSLASELGRQLRRARDFFLFCFFNFKT